MLTPAESTVIDAVRDLARTKFPGRAAAHDREGTFPAENVAELKALGVPGFNVPAQYGGGGASAEARARVIEEIAYGDGSTAVAMNMHWFTADILLLAPTPPAVAVLEDVGKNNALMCAPGSVASGQLDTRKSGYRARLDGDNVVVNGRAGFASMSEGATYVFLAGAVDRDGGGDPDLFFGTPRMDTPGIKNLHNWDAMGFRGTASHDIACEDVVLAPGQALVVPASFIAGLQQAAQALPAEVRQGRTAGSVGILAIWLGLSQAALDFTTAYVAERYGMTPITGLGPDTGYRANEAWAQLRIGEMAHQVHTGRVVLYDFARSLTTPYPSTEAFTFAFANTIYHLRRMSEEVAMGAMKVCGAHAYVRSRPLERIYRDLTGCIVMAWKTDQLAHQIGLGALGMPMLVGGPVGV